MKFIKDEIVFCIATMLAILSMFVIPPSEQYIEYIDLRVLGLLLCLMIVVAGFQAIGLFENIIETMLKHISTTRELILVLVLGCFFSSMLITNDVALITFVPFSIMILQKTSKEKLLIIVIVMQTIAANLGSMLTPLGNPQNLYLYSISGMGIFEFFKLMFPTTILSLALIVSTLTIVKNEKLESIDNLESGTFNKVQMLLYGTLFIVCLSAVLHIVDFRITLVVVIVTVFICNKKLLLQVDYSLLFTFVAFFIFVGNMKRLPYIESLLVSIVKGNEIIVSIIASQGISNVPTAILLSGFTDDYSALIVGTNIGGLGTLIASMASLISYKFYAKVKGAHRGKYIAVFTGINCIFLAIILISIPILY